MARIGVTLENVKHAREAILARGESVSIDVVRAELGHTGSKSTIHKHLKRLNEDEENASTEVLLSEELQQQVSHVAARLKKEAHATLEEKTEVYEQHIRDKGAQLAALSEQTSDLITQCEALQDEVKAAKDENLALKVIQEKADIDKTFKSQQINALEQQVAIADKHNASLEAKHQDARHALTHYRESMAQQREQESAKYEQECAQLRQACNATNQTLTAKQTTLREAQQRIKNLEKTLAVVSSELASSRNAGREYEKQIRFYRDNIGELAKECATFQSESQHAQARCDELDSVNRELERENDALREAKSRLEGQSQAQQSLIDRFTHINIESPG
ncbi:DNA-binding protein [Aliiglaciecola sp.]|nr:DNA-binding protein [Aliiglaciecola sp.]